ncbi:TPA: hypothetical protein IG203_004522 [Escherichia coli]|nr:hypothetical protein [Escherichia coli]HAO1235156.1 hypothetical protein [Escherichia coli]HAW3394264.1 hypothetical protein [Escherichia coli]HAX7638545.1 hypothetical protein [Escherichia coli]HAY3717330.1 hypothetical protein [Escherichia coli]
MTLRRLPDEDPQNLADPAYRRRRIIMQNMRDEELAIAQVEEMQAVSAVLKGKYTMTGEAFDPVEVDMHPLDFSLLNRREADEEPEDDVLMQKAAGLAGGVRFGPDGNEVIPASPDVADMTEDDVMLMTVSEGIAGGVRYG